MIRWILLAATQMDACNNTQYTEQTCSDALIHLEDCTGIATIAPECNSVVFEEAELILSLECSELQTGLDALPLCETLGSNCNSIPTCGTRSITASEYNDILTYSDSTTITSIEDVENRITAIGSIFSNAGDYRGLFPTVYRPITEQGVSAITNNAFTDTQWANDLIIEFAALYFENLRASMLLQPMTTSWERYYSLTEDCTASPLRTAAVGITTHLFIDLPTTLATISSSTNQSTDFEDFGLILVAATPNVITELDAAYGTDSEPFLRGYFLGDWVDSHWGENTTTTFAFQTIRTKAWNNGLWLQDWRAPIATIEMNTSWYAADGILATLDQLGSL